MDSVGRPRRTPERNALPVLVSSSHRACLPLRAFPLRLLTTALLLLSRPALARPGADAGLDVAEHSPEPRELQVGSTFSPRRVFERPPQRLHGERKHARTGGLRLLTDHDGVAHRHPAHELMKPHPLE